MARIPRFSDPDPFWPSSGSMGTDPNFEDPEWDGNQEFNEEFEWNNPPLGQRVRSIADVGTLVVQLRPRQLAETLPKFNGRWTEKTRRAALRIASKPKTVKVPAPVMRRLYIATGGWNNEWLYSDFAPQSTADYLVTSVRISSELTVFFDKSCFAWLQWRGEPIARNCMCWRDSKCLEKLIKEKGERLPVPTDEPATKRHHAR